MTRLFCAMVAAALFIGSGIVSPGAVARVLLDVQGGELLGAKRVNVGGQFYDVTFVDTSCVSLFNGCDNSDEDFDFNTEAIAILAAQALLDQVFVNDGNVAGVFDDVPFLTAGCIDPNLCVALIPWLAGPGTPTGGSYFYYKGAVNYCQSTQSCIYPDKIDHGENGTFATDYASIPNSVYAKFSPSAVVPVPAMALPFLMAVAAPIVVRTGGQLMKAKRR